MQFGRPSDVVRDCSFTQPRPQLKSSTPAPPCRRFPTVRRRMVRFTSWHWTGQMRKTPWRWTAWVGWLDRFLVPDLPPSKRLQFDVKNPAFIDPFLYSGFSTSFCMFTPGSPGYMLCFVHDWASNRCNPDDCRHLESPMIARFRTWWTRLLRFSMACEMTRRWDSSRNGNSMEFFFCRVRSWHLEFDSFYSEADSDRESNIINISL